MNLTPSHGDVDTKLALVTKSRFRSAAQFLQLSDVYQTFQRLEFKTDALRKSHRV